MYQYKKFCKGGKAIQDPKYENLLASFDITHPKKISMVDNTQTESLQNEDDITDIDQSLKSTS